MSRLAPLLVKDAKGNYGHVTTTYDVRFTQDGLKSLFGKPFTHDDAEFLRKTARRIVLLNALKTTDWPDVAWCYWSDDAYQTWLQLKFTINNVDRSFKIDPSPLETVKAKDRIKLNTFQLRQLHELFSTEESLIAGMVSLSNLVRSTESFTPKDFKDKLSDFGDALKGYDDRAFGQNATFALFDQLIQRAGGSRNSSLTLTAEVAPQPKTTKMLIA